LKPRLLVDALSLLSSLTGIGRYTYEISKELQKSKKFQLAFFYGYLSEKLYNPKENKGAKSLKSLVIKVPLLKKTVRKILTIRTQWMMPKYDIYWQPSFIPNKKIKAKYIITSVHDFSFLLYAKYHPKERMEYFEKNFFESVKRSTKIITGSSYTKKEILQYTDFSSEDIEIIYHGINHRLFYLRKNISVDFELPKKFILSVGSIEPRKNLLALLQAYVCLDSEIKSEYKLVLVGFKGWQNREIMEIIEANKAFIHYFGYVSDEELSCLYNLATVFVFPSLYEGFGLPPLEAMACGTPVISSNVTSMPEVCADAALYIDPHSVEDIKQKILHLLEDESLQKSLIQKGLQRAQAFTWEASAQKHMQLFEKVLDS
jgi:glycosyltransferase involved in cell wall biosynthesis